MQTCATCGPTEAAFPPRGSQCAPCRNATKRAYYQANKEKLKAQQRESYKKNKTKAIERQRGYFQQKKAAVDAAKNRPCMDCHREFPTVCMDFDHRPGGKKIGCVATMLQHGRPLNVLLEEIAKCDVVCACCHRIRTSKRRA